MKYATLLVVSKFLLVVLVAVAVASAPEYKKEDVSPELWRIYGVVHSRSQWVALLCAIGLGFVELLQYFQRLSVDNKKPFHAICNALYREYFGVRATDKAPHAHRVVIFEVRRPMRFLFLKKCLTVMSQSQNGPKVSKWTYFRCDEDVERNNRGIVGLAWYRNAVATVVQLPSWEENPEEYARQGNTTCDHVKRMAVKPCAISARDPSYQW